RSLTDRLRLCPGTLAWLSIVTGTECACLILGQQHRTTLLLSASTNLSNLGAGHFLTLLTCALFVPAVPSYLWFVIECGAFLLPLEAAIGTLRLLALGFLAHVGTCLLVALGLVLLTRHSGSTDRATVDVGTSYATRFLTAVPATRLQGQCRWALIASI